MAEMIELKPLFPGSSEIDQVHQVFSFLGQPTPFNWPEGVKLLKRMSIPLPDTDSSSQYSDDNGLRGNVSPSSSADLSKMNLIKAIPNANEGTISFLHRLLMMNPNVRPTAIEALDDPYFGVTQTIGQNDVTAPSRKRSAELHPFTECGAQNKSLTTPYLEGEVARQEKRNKSQNVQYDNLGQLSSLSAMNQFNCAQRATITPFDNQFNTGVQGTAGFQFKTSSMNTIDANSMHFGTTSSLNGCISQHNPFSLYDSFQ
jgi:serine/threonine protein kinase